MAFLIHEPSATVLLVSNGKVNCSKLVKENAGIYNGKGGGNDIQARAIFTKMEYVETFIDLIEKHLR
jgi:alanyl-tRNA synthetase